MKDLKKEELLERVGWWHRAYIEKYKGQLPEDKTQRWDRFNDEAYQQIRQLIQKPQVTEEWIESWRDYLLQRFPVRITGNAHNDWLDELKRMLKEVGVHV